MMRTFTRLATTSAVLAFFCVLAAVPAAAQRTGETVKDEVHGITFKVPKDWISIPLDPTEVLTIHKYQADRPDTARKVRFNSTASLEVMFFATPEEPGEGAKDDKTAAGSDIDKLKAYRKSQFRNYGEYAAKVFKDFEASKPQKKKVKGIPVTYHEMVGVIATSGNNTVEAHVKSAVFHVEEGEFVMQFSCLEDHYKKRHKSDMDASIRTFKRIERKGPAMDETALSQLTANERYIQEQIDKLSKGWYHFWSKNKKYVIFSNADKKFAKEIEKHLEGIRECYEDLFPGEPRLDWIPIVRVCRTKDEYHGYGGPSGSAGYWSDMTKEFVFYDDVARGSVRTTFTLKHEAFHHFIHFYLGSRPMTWFDEGCADYFAGGEFMGKRIKIKPNQMRRGVIQSAIVNKSYVPIKKLVYMTKQEYYAQSGLCYPQGWSFVYFLLEGRKNGAKVKKEWEKIPRTYLEHFKTAFAELEKKHPDMVAPENEVNYQLSAQANAIALEKTFEGWTDEDWQELEDAWADFTG